MRCLLYIHILFCFFILTAKSDAQTNSVNHQIKVKIHEVALLSLETDSPETTETAINSNQTTANQAVTEQVARNNNIWINYSSVVRDGSHRRRVTASVQGEMPEGCSLSVTTSASAGIGKGQHGKSAGKVYLSSEPVEIISDIGSCYTGKGIHNGHQISYQIELADNYT